MANPWPKTCSTAEPEDVTFNGFISVDTTSKQKEILSDFGALVTRPADATKTYVNPNPELKRQSRVESEFHAVERDDVCPSLVR